MENASGHLWKIPVEKVDFKIQGLSPNGWAPFEWKGAVRGGGPPPPSATGAAKSPAVPAGDSPQALQGKGSLSFKNPSGNGIPDFLLNI